MATSMTTTCSTTISLRSADQSPAGASYSLQAAVSSTSTTASTYRPTALILVNDSSTCHTRATDQLTITSDSYAPAEGTWPALRPRVSTWPPL